MQRMLPFLSVVASLAVLSTLCLAQGIEGEYNFAADAPSETGPAEGGEVILSLQPEGQLHLVATRPGDVLTTYGTYEVAGDRISLEMPELGKSVQGGAFALEGDVLTLPFQLMSDDPGTSQWRRIAIAAGAVGALYRKADEEAAKGKPAEEAVAAGAEAAKAQDPRIIGYEITRGARWCILDYSDGHREWVLVSPPSSSPPPPRPLPKGMLAGDPRTHIPAHPNTAPDDPPNKRAILFAPFHNAPYYGWTPDGRRGKVSSMAEDGEDLKLLEDKLRSAHWDVIVLQDAEATPKALYDRIIECGGNPGLLYVSSHGGAGADSAGFMAGVCLGKEEAWVHDLGSPQMKAALAANVPEEFQDLVARGSLEASAPVTVAWRRATRGVHLAFLGVMNGFFGRMVKLGRADFSRSLVYIDACSSAQNPAFATSFRARAFIGQSDSCAAYVSARQSAYLFSVLGRPTLSPAEAMGLMAHVVRTQQGVFFPEDDLLAGVPESENRLLTLIGADLSTCSLPTFDTLYLCWMARWNSGHPEKGAQALLDTYNQFWSKKHFSALASPFATAGVRGDHVPTEEEVNYARFLVSGTPTRPCGRFTLNDAEPSRARPEPH